MPKLEEKDKEILNILQTDGKIGLQALADRVNLSSSPCWRRVKRLEEDGLIDRYAAILNPRILGLRAQAYMQLTLVDHSQDTIDAFDRFVQNEPHIVECASITGSKDFLLKVMAKDAEALESFIMKRLHSLGVVQSTNTQLVLRQTKSSTVLPV